MGGALFEAAGVGAGAGADVGTGVGVGVGETEAGVFLGSMAGFDLRPARSHTPAATTTHPIATKTPIF